MTDYTIQIRALRDMASRLVSVGTDAACRAADAHTAAANLYERGDLLAAEIACMNARRAFGALPVADMRRFNVARFGVGYTGVPQTNACVDHEGIAADLAARGAR